MRRKREPGGVVLGTTYEAIKKRWRIQLIVIAFLLAFFFQNQKPPKSITAQIQELDELKTKEAIFSDRND